MEGNVYGYIRVSSTDQNEDRQRIALSGKQIPHPKQDKRLNFMLKRYTFDKF